MPQGKISRTHRSTNVPTFSRIRLAILLPGFLGSVVACSVKDQAKCDEAVQATRQALKAEQNDLMRQWRDRAWKYCEDGTTVQGLDKEIVDTQQAALRKKQAEEAEKKKLEQLGQTFATWVGQNRGAPEKASSAPECPDAERGKKKDERFCVATRHAGPYAFEVRYWEAEPAAARFSFKPGAVMQCSQFGPATELRSFNIPANGGQTAKRTVCQFTGGALDGMQMVMTNAVNADVHIFTSEYLEKDPAMKKYIGS